MTCKLCNLNKELRESHIIPKCIFRWLKDSGGDYFRSPETSNRRLHDGIKPRMLCNECEGIFSKLETDFSSKIFYPHVKKGQTTFEYNANLFKFSVSILWRVLCQEYSSLSSYPNFSQELYDAEKEWRSFLFSGKKLENINEIHLIFTTHSLNYNIQPVENFLYYHARGIDASVYSNSHFSFIYAKLARVIIIGEIANKSSFKFSNNVITESPGNLDTEKTKLEELTKAYMINRLKKINTQFDQISENQKRVVFEYADKQMKQSENTEMYKINMAQLKMSIDENFLDF
ncbi:hypothetical protein QWY99_14945 [Flavobacterium branchiarum]|uniref:HNH endonuclease n=1 Tax=Flavobacterium branchiarum TaxID=1114870 RepID=A0ABV5FMQ5_9FLAO|nr:hypothetical protein [Flavobacterium branchiarum]MDN3674354.1 hypothetical protein [Flavobacterium branchiarum]